MFLQNERFTKLVLGKGVCRSQFLNALSLFVQAVPQEVPRELCTGNTLLPCHSVISEAMYSDCM